jgi:hypothetical protein
MSDEMLTKSSFTLEKALIYERLENQAKEHTSALHIIQGDIHDLADGFKSIKKMLVGNGEVGIIEKVNSHEKDIKYLKLAIDKMRSGAWQIFLRVLPMVLTAAMTGFVFALLQKLKVL